MNTEIYSAYDSFGDATQSLEIAANRAHVIPLAQLMIAGRNPDWLEIVRVRFERCSQRLGRRSRKRLTSDVGTQQPVETEISWRKVNRAAA
jgi:hypothetical protein